MIVTHPQVMDARIHVLSKMAGRVLIVLTLTVHKLVVMESKILMKYVIMI